MISLVSDWVGDMFAGDKGWPSGPDNVLINDLPVWWRAFRRVGGSGFDADLRLPPFRGEGLGSVLRNGLVTKRLAERYE